MANKKTKLTLEERLKDVKSQYRKLTNMLQTIRTIQRGNKIADSELEKAAQQLKIAQKICKSEIEIAEMKEEAKSA